MNSYQFSCRLSGFIRGLKTRNFLVIPQVRGTEFHEVTMLEYLTLFSEVFYRMARLLKAIVEKNSIKGFLKVYFNSHLFHRHLLILKKKFKFSQLRFLQIKNHILLQVGIRVVF